MNAAVLLLMTSLLPSGPAATDAGDTADAAEEAVVAGREALDHWWGGYPWYDAKTDGVRRLEIAKPRDWSWLWDWLPDWNFSFRLPGSLGEWFIWIAIILLLAGVVYLLVRAYLERQAVRAKSGAEAKSTEAEEDADRIEALPFPLGSGGVDLLGEARRHYRQGNYAQAIIYLFSFQLVRLDRQQIIRLTKGKTNRQYLREVGPRRRLRELVEQTMVAFEDVFFGHHTLDRARFESCWSRLNQFEALAAEGAP